jgi:hypothetical protein
MVENVVVAVGVLKEFIRRLSTVQGRLSTQELLISKRG